MADKKHNEIIEEQRRAREEFLKLKKMQQGEMSAGPKPSEVAIVPKTPKEKVANFWFQYKWHTIGITFIVAVLIVLITQCATKPKYDYSIVYFSYTPVVDAQLDTVEDYFEEISSDLDGDGEVSIQVLNCSFSNTSNLEYRNSMLVKLQAIMASDQKTLLFITDKDSMKYFTDANFSTDIFAGEPFVFGADFYEKTESEEFGKLPEGLQISCRRVEDTTLEKSKDVELYYNEAKSIIEKLNTK